MWLVKLMRLQPTYKQIQTLIQHIKIETEIEIVAAIRNVRQKIALPMPTARQTALAPPMSSQSDLTFVLLLCYDAMMLRGNHFMLLFILFIIEPGRKKRVKRMKIVFLIKMKLKLPPGGGDEKVYPGIKKN